MLACLKGYRLILVVPPVSFAIVFVLLLFASDASGQQNSNPNPRPEIKLPDYSGWLLEKSEPVQHPTDKNLSAIVKKLKNPVADEWVILAKASNKKTPLDVWQRTFFLRLRPAGPTGRLNSLQVFDLISSQGKWFVDGSFAITSDSKSFLYGWIDNFYDDFIYGLKNPDEILPPASDKQPVKI